MANETKIDTLSIDIDYEAGTATSGLERLTSTLQQLSGITGSSISGLKQISTQLNSFTKVSQKLGEVDFASFSGAITSISSAVKPLTELGKSDLNKFINQLKKIPDINKQLDTKTINEFTKKIEQLSNAMIPLAQNITKVGTVLSSLPSKLNKVNNYASKTNQISSGFSSLNRLLNFGAIAALATRAGRSLGEFISKSNEYVEDLNLFNVAMGESTEKASQFIDRVSEALGLDPAPMMRYMGVFQMISSGFGLSAENAYKMSKNLTQLTYDISSFYNLKIDEAAQKVQSAIAGELEPIRRLGYALDQATLKQIALNYGIDESYTSMTQAEKAQLRYIALLTQNQSVQGDMARTITSAANAMRVLHSQFSILGREIGNMFIPMLLKIIPAAIAVVKVLNLVVRAIAKMFGFTLPDLNWDSVNTGAGAVGDLQDNLDGATKSAKALKRQLAGFDELNNLTSPTPSSGGGGAGGAGGGAGFELDLPDYDMLDGFKKGIDDLTDKIKKLFGISEDGFGNISWRWKDMDNRIKAVIATIGALIAIKGLLKLANMIRILGDAFVYVKALASKFFGVLVGSKATGSVSILTKLSTAFNSVASALGVSAGGLALIIAGIAAVVTTFVYAYKNNEKFRQSVKDLGKAFSNLVNTLRDKLQPIIEALQPLFDMFIKNFKSGAKDLLKIGYELIKLGLEQIIDGITASLTIMNQILQGDFSGAWQTFLDMLSNGWNNATDSMKEILPSMENLANGIKDSWGKVFQTISGLFTNLASWFYTTVITPIINFFTEIWNKVTEIFSSIWQNITDTFTGIVSFFDSNVSTPIANTFRTLWSAITGIFGKAFNWFDEKVIQPIVSVFKPLITRIGEIFTTIWQTIKALFGVAAKWFDDNVIQPIVKIFKAFWQTTKDIIQGIWNTVVEIIGKMAKWVYDTVIKPITQYASDLFNSIKKVVENIWNTATQIIGKIANWVNNNVIKPITSGFETIYTTVSRVVTNVWNSITRTFGGIASWINNNVVQPIGDFFWNTWERVANSISGIIRGAVNAALSGVERVVNFFINGLNRVVGVINALPGVNIGYVNPLYLPRFAKGGFPQTGQLFMAREAGAELVGQIGNRTAVANNDQIIAGIQQGVYNAMINAQSEQQSGGTIVNIGNKQIYKHFSSGLGVENNRLGTAVVRV